MKLFNIFNWVQNLVEAFTFYSGGGGGSQTSTGTTYTSNLPEYAKPFFEEAMKQSARNVFTTDDAGNVIGVKPYNPYTGQRVTPQSAEQIAVRGNIMGMQAPGEFDAAQTNLAGSGNLAGMAGGAGLAKALGYNPATIYGGTFTPGMADYYGDPYQQRVTDIALREGRRQGDIAQSQAAMGAIKRGTFGGGRQALMSTELERNLQQNLADIQAKGSAAGYQNAQQQFNADATRQLQAQQATQQGQTAAAQLAGQTGIAGLSSSIDAAKAQAATAAAEQTANLERLKTQATSAAEAQAIDQKIADLKYQTFMEAQNWEKAQLEFYNAMLRGNAGLAQTQVQYGAPNSPYQGVGMGLQGLSLMKALG